MANINPFRGIRYSHTQSNQLGMLLAPPYDVISPSYKKELQGLSPYNSIRLIIGNPSNESHKNSDYLSAKKAFGQWRQKGILKRDEKPSIYVYQQSFKINGKTFRRTGFIALSKLTAFGNKRGGILAHEHTLSGPKADRLKLTKACRANFSCIFSLYPDKEGVGKILKSVTVKKPDIKVAFPRNVQNKLWIISNPKLIQDIQKRIKNATLFIADGHHRYETALAYQAFRSKGHKGHTGPQPYDFVQMMFVAMEDPGLVILPTHRMLPKRLVGSKALLLSRLSSLGEIHEYKGTLQGLAPWRWMEKLGKLRPTLGISFDGKKLYALQFSKSVTRSSLLTNVSNEQKNLDVTLLHRLILEPFFGITKEKVEHEISFTSKAEEAIEKLRKGEFGATFFLNPTRIEQLREVALKQERMPQKSTYFYPKLVTGLVFNDLDSQ